MAICAETPNSGRDVEWLPLSGLKVLVVEDSWIVASSLKSLLENRDIAVLGPLGNLAEATNAARAMDFDVAIVDLDLHGLAADGLIAELHRSRRPVVIVTGRTAKGAVARMAAGVLPKPFRANLLLKLLREIRADLTANNNTEADQAN